MDMQLVVNAITGAPAPRASYQRGLVECRQRWSGSDLRGYAQNWKGVYKRSAARVVARIRKLLPENYAAQLAYVLERVPSQQYPPTVHRWCVELVIVDGDGVAWAWIDEQLVPVTETKTGQFRLVE